jgi:[ribosomal protein S18]-alanine N-acetyltransferase
MSSNARRPDVVITLSEKEDDRESCARIMAASEPWITLGIGFERALGTVSQADRELYVARVGDRVAGFALVSMQGVLSGYLQTIGVSAESRSLGIGARLLEHIEARIFREKPNVFLFVSSFNAGARRFYASHGYEEIGEVKDFLVAGHGEWLIRKTRGPLLPWAPQSTAGAQR